MNCLEFDNWREGIFYMARQSLTDDGIGYTFAFVVLGLLVVAVFLGLYMAYEKRRKKGIRDYCLKNGVKFIEKADSMVECSETFDLTSRGTNRTFELIMSGSQLGYDFQIFDFSYDEKTDESDDPDEDERITESVCLISKYGRLMPSFFMFERDILDGDLDYLPKIKGGKEVFFPKNKSFEEVYCVKTRNEAEVRPFLESKLSEIALNYESGFLYEAKGEYLLVSFIVKMSIEDRLKMLQNAIKMFNVLS